jgi:preprotein translocase subunit YajC
MRRFVLTGIAYAMGQAGAPAGQGAGGFGGLVPIILMFVIFYFLLIRPQQKRNKEHKEMINTLKKGDRIITSGGIYGRITGIEDNVLQLEIADRVRIKVVRSNVAALAQSGPAAPQEKKSKSDDKEENSQS